MKNKLIMTTSLLLVGTSILTGCGKEEAKKDPLIGKWAHGAYVYTFNEDKTCEYDISGNIRKCTYETDGDKISILYEGSNVPFVTTYEIKDNKLNIKDTFNNDTFYDKK
jgi:hypothetical protein